MVLFHNLGCNFQVWTSLCGNSKLDAIQIGRENTTWRWREMTKFCLEKGARDVTSLITCTLYMYIYLSGKFDLLIYT